MLKRDKNGFVQIIEEFGFSSSQFKRFEKDVESHPGFILQFVNSPLFFLARTQNNNYHEHDCRYVEFAPHFPKSEYWPLENWCDISDVYDVFKDWLKNHVSLYLEEIDVPDLWDQLGGRGIFNGDPLVDRNNEKFNKNEKQQVIAAIEHFKKLLTSEHAPSEDQLEVISDRLDYLTEAIDRLDKVDWQGVAVSTIMSISIALSLDTEKGRSLFDLFKDAFTTVAGLLN
jgi:hypothetical protein